MVQIEIFTSKSDKHLKNAMADIAEITSQYEKDEIQIKILDIEYQPNEIILEGHIKTLEKKTGVIENPIISFPLFVINNQPILVGISPEFKETMKEAIKREYERERSNP